MFQSSTQYHKFFTPLVCQEADYAKTHLRNKHYTMRISWLSGKRVEFALPQTMDTLGLKKGDKVVLMIMLESVSENWHSRCIIIEKSDDNRFRVELLNRDDPPAQQSMAVIEFKPPFNRVSYNRMECALDSFSQKPGATSAKIFNSLLSGGACAPLCEVKPLLPMQQPLNAVQSHAVQSAVAQRLTLIQGPPGTGKTLVSTAIAYHLVKQTKQKVLACSPSNVTADQLALRMHKLGLKVVRVQSRAMENSNIKLRVGDLALHKQVLLSNVGHLAAKRAKGERLEFKDMQKLYKAESEIIDEADVVCTTLSVSGDRRLVEKTFFSVLIDEAGQCVEPEAMIAITHGCHQLVLIGDHKQLPPTVLSQNINESFKKSLFQRLVECPPTPPIKLTTQYRMHPKLSTFSSKHFYQNEIMDGVSEKDRPINELFNKSNSSMPMVFVSVKGKDSSMMGNFSWVNEREAIAVKEWLNKLFDCKVAPQRIAVITPYTGQRTFISLLAGTDEAFGNKLHHVEVCSVDGFQGREKDFIIYTAVRSNDRGDMGFLDDERRLNVAVTRAKLGLIMIGNAGMLREQSEIWDSLVDHFDTNQCLVGSQHVGSDEDDADD